MYPVVWEEFFTVSFTYLEYTGVDDVVAYGHQFVQFIVGCVVGYLGHIATGVNTPVQVEFGKQGFRHPFVGTAVGVGVVCLGQLRDYFQQFFSRAFQQGNITVKVHHHEVIECTNGAYRSHDVIFTFSTSDFKNHGVTVGNTGQQIFHHAYSRSVGFQTVYRRQSQTSIVIITIIEGYAHHFVTLEHDTFPVVASQAGLFLEIVIASFKLSLCCNGVIGEFCVLGFDFRIQIGTSGCADKYTRK